MGVRSEVWAVRIMHSWPKKGYFDFGKPWKAIISRRSLSDDLVSGARREEDLSNFSVKVAEVSSWTTGVGRFSRFSTSQFAPVSARDW